MNTKFFLDKKAMRDNNKTLSKFQSDTANIAKTWLFLRPNHATNGIDASANPSYTGVNRLSSYGGVTPQNKPFFGEYVGRCLWKPRVNPITLFGRFSQTQNSKGAFAMNAISKSPLDKKAMRDNNKTLSKTNSDTANIAKTWLFLRPNHATNGIDASANPSYTGVNRLSSYGGVTPQNKPFFGEYVGRFLLVPRVNPITLFGRFSQTQKLIGAFKMNAISNTIISTINKFSIFTPIESLVLGFILGLPLACLVFGILAFMGV